MSLSISYDENLIAQMKSKFDLRAPNVEALKAIIRRLERGNFHPQEQLVLDLATGVGKTYIMAALVEYLRCHGVMNVMIVTPNTVVQNKTVADFAQGSNRYIGGFDVSPVLVTPDDVQKFRLSDSWYQLFAGEGASTVFIFNVQQLFPPKKGGKNEATGLEAQRRKTWRFQEDTGILAQRLIDLDDLVVIVDEAHLFGATAARFQESLKAFHPAATIGLTASPAKDDDVVFRYPLWKAICNRFVKQPVLVYRESGYLSEERQLQDAISLLRFKEEAYSAYRNAHPRGKQTKPLLFVVCADVNHATETATLLRNTYFTDAQTVHAVLQVDNQHDDATTQTLLRNLDEVNSPVQVIVSVNKLREGWDTKRIAVMCTLRAMGSEVLTQQVMGRGLRLPFGVITDRPAIDELEIISHKSFVSLLKSENVLREFGIEEEVPGFIPGDVLPPAGSTTKPEISSAVTGGGLTVSGGSEDAGTPISTNEAMTQTARGTTPVPVGARNLQDDEDITAGQETYEPVAVKVNEGFKNVTFTFPSSTMIQTLRPFSLLDISQTVIVQAAKKVSDTADELERAKIVVSEGEKKLDAQQLVRLKVPSFHQSKEGVERELTKKLMETRLFQATRENDMLLRRSIIPVFMKESSIEQWTEKAKQSAVRHLVEMVKQEARNAARDNTFVEVSVQPVVLPVQDSYMLSGMHDVQHLLENVTKSSTAKDSGFVRRQHYGPWTKGLFDAAAFDSFSAEYQLARILDLDSDVQWWTRIYDSDGAKIAYTTRNDYVPDFVVLDKDNTYWIIEGKADDQRDNEIVAKKRDATERLLRSLIAHPDYQDQKWAYLIVFESDIKNSDSLAELIGGGGVERMFSS